MFKPTKNHNRENPAEHPSRPPAFVVWSILTAAWGNFPAPTRARWGSGKLRLLSETAQALPASRTTRPTPRPQRLEGGPYRNPSRNPRKELLESLEGTPFNRRPFYVKPPEVPGIPGSPPKTSASAPRAGGWKPAGRGGKSSVSGSKPKS